MKCAVARTAVADHRRLPVVGMGSTDLDRVRRRNRLRSIRFGYALRVVLAAIMIGAILVGVDPNSGLALGVLVTVYALAAVSAVVLVHSSARHRVMSDAMVLAFSGVDVVAVLLFEMLTAGGFIPLLLVALPVAPSARAL
jgi:two-component system NarL family sensor kinase